MLAINKIDLSGRLAKDAIFKEKEGRAPITEIFLVNSKNARSKDKEGNRRSFVTVVKVVFRGAKARKTADLRQGDGLIILGGYLADDNFALEGGEKTVGRLRIENPQFIPMYKDDNSYEEEMLASEKTREEEPLQYDSPELDD